MATKIVGLDLGTHSIKVSELVTTFRNFELVGFGSEPVAAAASTQPTAAEMAVAARRLLERRGLIGETIICALPPNIVSNVTLDLPFHQPKKVQAVLPFQLDEVIPFDVEDVVHDYQILERREDGSARVLVSYVKEETFGAFLEALSAVGVDPKVISVGPLAWYNVYDYAVGEAEAPVAILDIGHCHSELCIFVNGEPANIRDMPTGGRDVTAALAEVFKVDADQAERGKLDEGVIVGPTMETLTDAPMDQHGRQHLISETCREAMAPVLREVRRSLAAHDVATGRPVERVLLTGGGSQLRGLRAWLQDALGISIELLDPLSAGFNKLADRGDRLRPYIGRSLALSLRAFQRTHHSMLNFRKGDFSYTGDFGFLKGRVISVTVSLVMIVVLGAMVAVSRKRVLEAEYQTLQNQTLALSQEILGYESDDADLLFTTITAQQKQSAFIPEVSAFQVMKELSDHIGFDIRIDLDQLEVDISRRKLAMRGKTNEAGDVERIVDAIRKGKCFGGRVNKERVEKSMDERTKFRLSANSTCI